MYARRLFSLILVLILLATLTGVAAAAPLAGPCMPGAVYDSGCDANHDGQITIADIQLTAGHWNQNGTFVSDSNHTHLGQTWTGNNNPLTLTGAYGAPLYAPLNLSNSAGIGLRITSAGNGSGIWIDSASSNGVEIRTAQNSGVLVNSAGWDGVFVSSAGATGVFVSSAGYDGVWANTTQASGQWGFYTPDAIHGSNVLMHSLSLVGQVTGPDSLTPGDIVAVAGVADPVPGSTVHTPLVRLAGGTFANVVGVVESHLALTQQPSHPQPAEGETPTETPVSELRSVAGPAQPGDYVAITVLGAARVKVQGGETILTGQRLTAGDGGSVRALQFRTVEGMVVTEGAPVIGVALEASDKNGMFWVFVNPQ